MALFLTLVLKLKLKQQQSTKRELMKVIVSAMYVFIHCWKKLLVIYYYSYQVDPTTEVFVNVIQLENSFGTTDMLHLSK